MGVHEAMPEKELPLTAAVTGWLYQPLESGERAGAAETEGVEISTCSVYCWLAMDGPGQVAEQDTVLTVSVLK